MLYKNVQENYRLTDKEGFGTDHSKLTQIKNQIKQQSQCLIHGETTR